ncbi:hypothetical protein [Nonomuraea typhae]|uniref:hypothetical protein n=1 Tax=Nonomuraea typhae TaxID=2603600 RepID=UPI0012F7ABE2|nr:hypothetical protein [Nonomuraea typhae]
MTATSVAPAPTRRPAPLAVTVSAWAVPVMVVGQFALLSGIPVTIALAGALLRVRDRMVRRAAALVAVSYLIPLVIWLTRPDGAPSLSKDMHPGFAGLMVAASAALIVALFRARRH